MSRKLPWVLNVILVITVIAVSAQTKQTARVPLISDTPSDPDVAKRFQDTLSKGGYISNLNRIMANAPKLMTPAGAYASALRYSSEIPRQYLELMIVRITQREGGDYENNLHKQMALSCGVSQAKLDALANWRKSSSLYEPKERAILAYSDAMSTKEGPDDATFQTLSSFFTPGDIVTLTFTNGWYIGHSRESIALRIPKDEDLARATQGSSCKK